MDKDFLESFFRTIRIADMRIEHEGIDPDALEDVRMACASFLSAWKNASRDWEALV